MIPVYESVSQQAIKKAVEFAESHKGSVIDLDGHKIVIPFSKDSTEEDLMSDGMLGKWFIDNGFDISFEKRDVEYVTKDKFSVRGMNRTKGHKANLKDRLVGTITW